MISSNSFDRSEHNVAMVKLKTKLRFSHDSAYLPVCLPTPCYRGEECRTRDGKLKSDWVGSSRTMMTNDHFKAIYSLTIISNAECDELRSTYINEGGNTHLLRTIKRLVWRFISPIINLLI